MRDLAFSLAKEAHKGQVDKNGVDYMQHLLFVEENVVSKDAKIVALLHDVIEDTNITEQDLIESGFSKSVIEAIKCLTKTSEDRELYLIRVKENKLAKEVKIADLMHNSMISRYKSPDIKSVKKCIEYLNELKFLLDN